MTGFCDRVWLSQNQLNEYTWLYYLAQWTNEYDTNCINEQFRQQGRTCVEIEQAICAWTGVEYVLKEYNRELGVMVICKRRRVTPMDNPTVFISSESITTLGHLYIVDFTIYHSQTAHEAISNKLQQVVSHVRKSFSLIQPYKSFSVVYGDKWQHDLANQSKSQAHGEEHNHEDASVLSIALRQVDMSAQRLVDECGGSLVAPE